MRRLIVGLIVTGLAIAAVGAVVALASEGDPHQKVTLCHATGSQSNPYVSVTVDINSIQDAERVGGHGKHEGDIIPSYTFTDSEGSYTYPGQNLDKLNILENGCKVPGEVKPTPPVKPTPLPVKATSPKPPTTGVYGG